ncbi:Dehydrogenase/reductase SDR family member 11 [Hypsibius exemplaris]|uniref:Dehydrogenase/reductase SDR family member 11 n=1 Tax=Hypsibius exemplaris TaxID=2072580 RepID=A0A1W0WNS2_HYPEX|nr:Dehydrogenase/reductase SDR family member 11 [Hypsibius exemplaris]
MTTSLEGRIILVTGASAGIGFATAEELVQRGATVIGAARNIKTIQELSAKVDGKGKGELFPVKADISKEEDILTLFKEIDKKYGKLDVLINNAGRGGSGTLLEGNTQEWKDILDLNVLGLTIASREAVKLIESGKSTNGHIINVSSVLGHYVPNGQGFQFYAGAKHMVTALTKALRKSVQAKNIRVTNLSPGIVATEIVERVAGKAAAEAFNGPHKVLEAKDIADAIVYILTAPTHVNIDELTISPTK